MNVKTIVITIKYRNPEETFAYNLLFEAYPGIVVDPYRKMVIDKVIIKPFYYSQKKCRSCQYRQAYIKIGPIDENLEWINPRAKPL